MVLLLACWPAVGARGLIAAIAVLTFASPASAQLPPLPLPGAGGPAPQPYRANDPGGFRNILPPGENGHVNAVDLLAFQALGRRPPHNDDQYASYQDLLYGTPVQDVGRFFKDASFGVAPGDVESTISPRPDVTIVRDRGFGVPHIYGSTRAGAMFGIGYATAQDRLFMVDVLRHAGRAELSSFAGGAKANRAMDEHQWAIAPYTEADLQRQLDGATDLYGAEGAALLQDLDNYVAGVNRYIAEARLDPTKMPAEYGAIGRPQGPEPFKGTDVVAIASLVGGIFGVGGGGELYQAELLRAFRERFGARRGRALWLDFRQLDDPESPTTVDSARFPYETLPARVARGSVAMPDPGSVRPVKMIAGTMASGAPSGAGPDAGSDGPATDEAAGPPRTMSNAIVVGPQISASGHPIAVFGPQVAYFAPEILMEQDVHAPGIDARGAAFPGTNLYVQLGRGRNYAWSATSAGQDIVDTFAVPLCGQDAYVFRGRCEPMETLTRTNTWTPNLADQTPPGSETITTQRTKLGIVIARATIHGKPVAYTSLRSTYFHETDSARGFAAFNDPDRMTGPDDFKRAAAKIGYTFNWFYADDRHSAYFNSGNNPVRAPRTDPLLPVNAGFEWRSYDPAIHTAAFTPRAEHPQAVDQPLTISWNNKQARGYASAGPGYGPVYRSQLLDDQLRARLRAGKLTLPATIDAMEEAGTADLRATHVLPLALEVLGTPRDPKLAAAVRTLRAWVRAGGQRKGAGHDGPYAHADAIAILDAWWPRWLAAEFRPGLGAPLYKALQNTLPLDNPPNIDPGAGVHLGSSWQGGWYGYVSKDLRASLGRRVRAPMHRRFCGSLARCRAVLAASLSDALAVDRAELYRDPSGICPSKDQPDPQRCFDAIAFRPLGGVTQPMMDWVNRPTFQQVVEITGAGATG